MDNLATIIKGALADKSEEWHRPLFEIFLNRTDTIEKYGFGAANKYGGHTIEVTDQ